MTLSPGIWRRGAVASIIALTALVGAYAGTMYLTGNIHTVVPGELYRSATLSPEQLEDTVRTRGIRTIVNLRGASQDAAWYRNEAAAARAAGVRLIDLSWSARRELTDEQVAAFFSAVAGAEKPILIHCRSGSDRTGLASALYLAGVKRSEEASAEAQLSVFFGHIGLPFLPSYAMDATFERLEAQLGYPDS